jgi:hypothetical protein
VSVSEIHFAELITAIQDVTSGNSIDDGDDHSSAGQMALKIASKLQQKGENDHGRCR